ncbi:MAG TPA: alpha/beta hydrolase [Prosthecobacter sp.]|nr:alpha/beta hydrolase [Prosthecobacter sp.]
MRFALLSLLCLPLFAPAAPTVTPEFLAEALKRYPDADANKDGTLTLAEGQAYLQKMRNRKAAASSKSGLQPTQADIAYGPHERNKLDFWKAPSEKPTPIVVFIHGGGFVGGDKTSWRGNPLVKQLLDKGVSCAAINYRFRDHAPIQDILRDAARAVQFLRHKAGDFNIDKTHIAAMGGSAGAGTSLWLTTRDDLADPNSSDPVLRESSRVVACVLNATQATYDITRWESFLGKADPAWARPNEGPAFYGFKDLDELASETAKPILRECDMLSWISKDDGPVFCTVNQPDGPVRDRGHWLHHPKHAEEIHKVCTSTGVPCTVARDGKEDALAFLLKNLTPAGAE